MSTTPTTPAEPRGTCLCEDKDAHDPDCRAGHGPDCDADCWSPSGCAKRTPAERLSMPADICRCGLPESCVCPSDYPDEAIQALLARVCELETKLADAHAETMQIAGELADERTLHQETIAERNRLRAAIVDRIADIRTVVDARSIGLNACHQLRWVADQLADQLAAGELGVPSAG